MKAVSGLLEHNRSRRLKYFFSHLHTAREFRVSLDNRFSDLCLRVMVGRQTVHKFHGRAWSRCRQCIALYRRCSSHPCQCCGVCFCFRHCCSLWGREWTGIPVCRPARGRLAGFPKSGSAPTRIRYARLAAGKQPHRWQTVLAFWR